MSKGSSQKLLKSFGYAACGIKAAFRSELNLKIHFTAIIVTTIAGFALKISTTEWLTILLLFALVVSLELVNTSIEILCNIVDSELNDNIKKIKDIAAGAVLFSSFIALIAGIIIFAPKLISYL